MIAIKHTVTPPGYTPALTQKQQTAYFNKWAAYIHKEVKKIKS